MLKNKLIKLNLLALMFILILNGCSLKLKPETSDVVKKPNINETNQTESIEEKLAKQGKIKKFTDLNEIKNFLKNNNINNANLGRNMGGFGITKEVRTLSAPMMEKSISADQAIEMGSATSDYSKTNVQVVGIDEADIIKTDGEYIYAVSHNDLFIIQASSSEELKILSKINFKSRPQNIYINDNYLAIFGSDDQIYKTAFYKLFQRKNNFTFLKVFDITDRNNPKQVRDLDFEGSYFNSRLIGNYIYFVTNTYNYYLENEPVLPRIMQNGKIKCELVSEKCKTPNVYYFDIPYNNYNFTSIHAINIADNQAEINSEIYVLDNGQNMYVSKNNIYITYTKYINEYEVEMEIKENFIFPQLNNTTKEKINKIKTVDNYILNKQEKLSKIAQIIQNYTYGLSKEEQRLLAKELQVKIDQKFKEIADEIEKTVIHKIAINGSKLEYKTNGEVIGRVLNQFSMDESGDYFRIATTKNRSWRNFRNIEPMTEEVKIKREEEAQSYNNLYVLDKDLKTVGALEGLAKNERIYSVRFMQNRAYMVTFRQTDPLFVIDLSNPQNPNVLGKLKIPGFSNYLHPFDENILIGIGKDTQIDEDNRVYTKGLKLSLFDVSDVASPQEIDTYVLGDRGSDSIALHDHKAFLFSKEKNLLVIPVTERKSDDKKTFGELVFRGAAVFQINEKGFTLQGKIDHSEEEKELSDNWQGYNYYNTTVKRSLYIDDNLYTFSNKYLKKNQLDNLELIKVLKLNNTEEEKDDFEIIN